MTAISYSLNFKQLLNLFVSMALFGKRRKAGGLLAVRIHADGISAARLSHQGSGLPFIEYSVFLPVQGSSLAELLTRLMKEAHADQYQCSCVLDPGEYQLLSVEAPNVPPEELKTAIRWRLKDMLDFHVNDATIDVLDVPADKNAGTRPKAMYAVAARNQLIRDRQELFAKAKFPLSVIDIPEMAQRNIAKLMEPEGRGLGMLSFDESGGLLTVTCGGELFLSRRIDLPYSQLIQAGEDERVGYFDRITLELQRTFDHFDRQYHFVSLAKLVLSPTGSEIPGFRAYLSSNFYLPVESFDLKDVFNISAASGLASPEQQQRHFLTLGAALRLEEKAL